MTLPRADGTATGERAARAAPHRASPAQRRVGYAIAIAVNLVLGWLTLVTPGWRAVPFLTEDMTAVLPWFLLSLVAGVAVNVLLVAFDPPWLRSATDVVTGALAAVVLARLLVVRPFDLPAGVTQVVVPWVLLALLLACVVAVLVNVAVTVRRLVAAASP